MRLMRSAIYLQLNLVTPDLRVGPLLRLLRTSILNHLKGWTNLTAPSYKSRTFYFFTPHLAGLTKKKGKKIWPLHHTPRLLDFRGSQFIQVVFMSGLSDGKNASIYHVHRTRITVLFATPKDGSLSTNISPSINIATRTSSKFRRFVKDDDIFFSGSQEAQKFMCFRIIRQCSNSN